MLVWLLAAGIVYVVRRPLEPPVGPRTLDLGPEPPAVANFLVNDFRVTDEAVPATLLDLAARRVVEVEERGPDVYYVRLRPAHDEALTAYERRVLEHLSRKASDGVVPAEALTTGPGEESKRWWRAFVAEVVADAQSRGLSRDRLDKRLFTALTVAAAAPGALAWALFSAYEAGLVAMGVAVAILGWIRARHPQQETTEGLAAASRWLGVRAELAENEVFATHSPLTVALWDRHLSYGAALDVAAGAVGPLPMGVESDRHAWSSYGGRGWRPVRIRYSGPFPLGWGLSPFSALFRGLAVAAVAGFVLVVLARLAADAASSGIEALVAGAVLAVPVAALVSGALLAIKALADFSSTTEVRGQILRLRAFGSDDDGKRYYVAVDDGTSSEIRAWVVSPRLYTGLTQGEVVTATVTRYLGCVRSITTSRSDA